jgi:hypothetical protein
MTPERKQMAEIILPTFSGHHKNGILSLMGVSHGTQRIYKVYPGIQTGGCSAGLDW